MRSIYHRAAFQLLILAAFPISDFDFAISAFQFFRILAFYSHVRRPTSVIWSGFQLFSVSAFSILTLCLCCSTGFQLSAFQNFSFWFLIIDLILEPGRAPWSANPLLHWGPTREISTVAICLRKGPCRVENGEWRQPALYFTGQAEKNHQRHPLRLDRGEGGVRCRISNSLLHPLT
jgi:hypothetical protein